MSLQICSIKFKSGEEVCLQCRGMPRSCLQSNNRSFKCQFNGSGRWPWYELKPTFLMPCTGACSSTKKTAMLIDFIIGLAFKCRPNYRINTWIKLVSPYLILEPQLAY